MAGHAAAALARRRFRLGLGVVNKCIDTVWQQEGLPARAGGYWQPPLRRQYPDTPQMPGRGATACRPHGNQGAPPRFSSLCLVFFFFFAGGSACSEEKEERATRAVVAGCAALLPPPPLARSAQPGPVCPPGNEGGPGAGGGSGDTRRQQGCGGKRNRGLEWGDRPTGSCPPAPAAAAAVAWVAVASPAAAGERRGGKGRASILVAGGPVVGGVVPTHTEGGHNTVE